MILGNSHTEDAVSPAYFDLKTYNIVSSSQTVIYDKYLIDKYIKELPKLKYVFLNVDYHSMYGVALKERALFFIQCLNAKS